MSDRIEKAVRNHKKGYNCAQSVACAFCDKVGVDEKTMFKATEGFGLGMGTMSVCGAISGAITVAGLCNSDGAIEAPRSKGATYALVREIQNNFEEKNTSVICRELKGLTGKPMLRTCDGCIEDAARILEEKCFPEAPEASEAIESCESPQAAKATESCESPQASQATESCESPEASKATEACGSPEAYKGTKACKSPQASEATETSQTTQATEAPAKTSCGTSK